MAGFWNLESHPANPSSRPRRRWDAPTVVLHALALGVWPFTVGYVVFKLLLERFPPGATRLNPDRRRTP